MNECVEQIIGSVKMEVTSGHGANKIKTILKDMPSVCTVMTKSRSTMFGETGLEQKLMI